MQNLNRPPHTRRAATNSTSFLLTRDEGAMMVCPDHPLVRDFLMLEYREMEKVKGRMKFTDLREPMWRPDNMCGRAALLTHQGFWKSLKEYLESKGYPVAMIDSRPDILGQPNYGAALGGLKPYQRQWIIDALKCGDSGLIGGPTRFGKCLGPETPVLTAGGLVKPARLVHPGDLLMGPDSKPRKVLNCVAGKETMFRVTAENGDSFDCTDDHYLVLSGLDGEKLIVMLSDFLLLPPEEQITYSLVYSSWELPERDLSVDPYEFGRSLHDGDCGPRRIPDDLMAGSRPHRLQLLRGILDGRSRSASGFYVIDKWKHPETADEVLTLCRGLGVLSQKSNRGDVVLKKTPNLTKDLAGETQTDRGYTLKETFCVRCIGPGDYYGFELSGDREFLLGNGIVSHNSYGMTAILKAFPHAVSVVTAPGVDLCRQLLDHFKETIPHREVLGVFSGSRNRKQSKEITVCSMDSLDKMDPGFTDLLILDEPHASVSAERKPKVELFSRSRKYGFGATLNGRSDKKDRLIEGLIGPVISNVSYLEGVAMEAISPLKVIFIKIPFSKDTIPGNYADRDIVYQRLLTRSTRTAALVRKIMQELIPDHWQTMAFIQNEKQALFYLEHTILPAGTWLPEGMVYTNPGGLEPIEAPEAGVEFDYIDREKYLARVAREHGTIAMAKRMGAKERREVTQGIVDGTIWRVIASNIYVQGLTFPDLKVVVNLAGGGANTTAIQKPGRLLQLRPNKNYGVMVDFMFECSDSELEIRKNPPYSGVVGECHRRYQAYKEIGYDIEFVDDSSRAREIILGAYDAES